MFSTAGKKICFKLSLLLQNVLREIVFFVSIFDFCLKNRDIEVMGVKCAVFSE